MEAAELGASIPDSKKWLMLVGDDPKDLEEATWPYKRLMVWCSPARPTQWMGTVVEELDFVCERLANEVASDFGLTATMFDSKEEAERAINEHMSEGIN